MLSKSQKIGASPRGAVRDRITHFDECGLCLFWYDKDPTEYIKNHNWNALFVISKKQWIYSWRPIVFGHALFEMLLNPFIGLTSKVMIIKSEKPVYQLSLAEQDHLIKTTYP